MAVAKSAPLWDEQLRDEIGDRSAEAILGANPFVGFDPPEIVAAASRLFGRALQRPRLVAHQAQELAAELTRIAAGRSQVEPPPAERRFVDPTWHQNPLYHRVMQAYLTFSESLHRSVQEAGLDEKNAQRADFAVTMLTAALAPTNFLLGNPAALKRAFETGGASLVRGARHWWDDLRHNGGMPSQVDRRPFRVGENLATSPGSVVHRSELLELIQYAPSTESVRTRPILIVPPQINKYYILDLAPGRSFVEYAVRQGQQVFAISWRNPTPRERNWGLAIYLEAMKDAISVACEIAGVEDVNLMAACAGGITTVLLLGHLAALGLPLVRSVTLLVTVLDTSVPSMMGMFASDRAIDVARRYSAQHGVLSGQDLARVFAWLRPDDLVWNYWVNNYLLGNEPPAFDILSWNNDSTNLPAALHSDFLTLFQENPAVKPGSLEVLGTPIDLSKVKCESYCVGALTDHITPWKACFRTPALLGGRSQFVLSSSGHIQAMVNPPGNPKARYFTGGEPDVDADTWLEHASEHAGSWWDHWLGWLNERDGDTRKAPEALGSSPHPALAPAPGLYVRQ
jgi:poly[(R)-3-hydroxyalkanoate] polymerase subunit PhaC